MPVKLTTSSLITTFEYDNNQRLIKKLAQSRLTNETRIWTYHYQLHTNGKVKQKITNGPLPGDTDSFTRTFDEQGNLLSKVNALGHTISFGDYDALGNAGFMIDANGLKTRYKYNKMGRLRKQIVDLAEPKITKYKYNAFGKPTKITAADGNITTFHYDKAYRKTKSTNALSQSIRYKLDGAGNILRETYQADETPWTFNDCTTNSIRPDCVTGLKQLNETVTPLVKHQSFDALNRVISSGSGNEQQRQFSYDANGNVVSSTDGQGNTNTYEYDHLNRRVAVTDPQGNRTTLQYNAQNKVIKVTDARGNATTYSYNAFGEKVSQKSPDSGEKHYGYNAAGQLTSMTDANGNQLTYSHDVLGRIISKLANNEVIHHYQYDDCENGLGRLCNVLSNVNSGKTSTEHYQYHQDGSLDKKTNTLAGQDYQLKYQYDINGRVQGIHYPGGMKVKYKRDEIGNVVRVKVDGEAFINQIRYKPFGAVKGWTFGNGQQRAVQYDAQYRVSRILASGVQDLDYQRDLSGNITSLANLRYAQDDDFGYDELNRLTTIGGDETQDFAFDSLGNRTTESANEATYTVAEQSNRLMAVTTPTGERTFDYDANGNITHDAGADNNRVFSYNTNNRMESVTVNGQTTHYSYNAKGQRVSKQTAEGDVVFYIYGHNGKLLVEITNDQISKQYIYLNGQLVGFTQNEQLYNVFTDHQGRPEIVTDASAATVWQAKNNAFGRTLLIENVELNIGFPGQYFDQEKQSWYNGHRDYDATLGRYLQSDPIGVRGGLNTYLYGNANTLMFTDEMGLLPEGGNGPIPPSNTTPPCTLSDYGANMIKTFEDAGGPSLTVYEDEAGYNTIGWGHKILPGEDFSSGITLEQAVALFNQDNKIALDAVNTLITFDMTQTQFDAIVSLVFNIGVSRFANSQTLVELNKLNTDQAMVEWAEWRLVKGTVIPGLETRRKAEIDLFLNDIYP